MIDFIDGDTIILSEEIIKKDRKTIFYANNNSYKSFTGEDIFDLEKNKTLLLDYLKKLQSFEVEEFTFYKKWEELQQLHKEIITFDNQAKARIWEPEDINNEELTIKEINNLRPKVIVVNNDNLEILWLTLRTFCHSAEFDQSPGRFIKFLIIDEVSDKVLGLCAVGSDFINLAERDEYIGWTTQDKLDNRMLKHSAVGNTIAPTQPFGTNFLGGKLIAGLITSSVVRNEWENQERGTSIRCKLVGMTTTSLYGPFSMYNSHKFWRPVGSTKGKIPIKPYENIYKEWHHYFKQHNKEEYDRVMTQKEGIVGPVTGAKMRVIEMIFDACNIKPSDFYHSYQRGIYYSCFYENTKEFLCRRITEDKLIMKPLFKDDEEILKWWSLRAINRYKKLKSENRLNHQKLFYNEMVGMNYEDAKNKFFKDVGR